MPRRTARTVLLAASALVAALTLAACSPGDDGSSNGGNATGAVPSPTGTPIADATVSIRLVLAPTNLDIRQTSGVALDQILIDNVYQGLVAREADGTIVPSLASEYDVSDDGLTYTFTLSEGVTFHDGQELTSEDVVWSLQTRKDSPEWNDASRLAGISTLAADGQTVTITLAEPDSSFLWNLSGRAGIILKQDDTVDYATATNGTGPFEVTSVREGDSITLTRNEDYWGDAPGVAEVVFQIIPEHQAALQAANAGEIDIITGFDATLREQVEASGDYTLYLGGATDTWVLAINSEREPTDDVRVREALRLAIDREAIIEVNGSGVPLFGPIPELDPGYEDLSDVISYDPDAARQLLEDAGVEDLELELTIPSAYPASIPQILVSNFNDIGVTLRVNSVEFSTWLNDVYANRDFDLSIVNHTEPRDFENWANPDYYFTFDDSEVQSLYAQSLAATDDATADALLAEAARIVSEDHAADWLFNGNSVVVIGNDIAGMPIDNVNARINLADILKLEG